MALDPFLQEIFDNHAVKTIAEQLNDNPKFTCWYEYKSDFHIIKAHIKAPLDASDSEFFLKYKRLYEEQLHHEIFQIIDYLEDKFKYKCIHEHIDGLHTIKAWVPSMSLIEAGATVSNTTISGVDRVLIDSSTDLSKLKDFVCPTMSGVGAGARVTNTVITGCSQTMFDFSKKN